MKKKELEILLQQVPSYDKSVPQLEQYLTPANIAADIVFIAYQHGDIRDKTVLDLGCGTGIFAVGAYLTDAKKVIGIDVDRNSIEIARKYAQKKNFEISYFVKNVKEIKYKCDTVIMNPPFGAQKSNRKADRIFIEKGFEISNVIYSLHLKKTVSFLEKLISALDGEITFCQNYAFPIKGVHDFHKKIVQNFETALLRISTKS